MKAPILTGTRSAHEILSTIGSAQMVAAGGLIPIFLVIASGLGLTAYNIISDMKEDATLEDLARRIDELAEKQDKTLETGVIAKPADMALAFEQIADMQGLKSAKLPFDDIRRPWLMLVEWLDGKFRAAGNGSAAMQGIAETLREGFDTRLAVMSAEQRELLIKKNGELATHWNKAITTLQAQLEAIRMEGIETFLSVEDLRSLTQKIGQDSATEHGILFDAVMQLSDEVKQSRRQLPPAPPPRGVIGLPGRIGERFTGRDLAALTESHFSKPAAPGTPPLVLHGVMGVGKTTLAAELLYHLHDAGIIDHAILLPAGDAAAVPALVENLALVLGLVPGDQIVPPELSRQALRSWFSPDDIAGRVVIFFDNADTPESQAAVMKEVTAFPMLQVMVTSRRSDWPRATPYEVRKWTPQQALDFLAKRLPTSKQEDRELLCKELGHLPLALELSGAVMSRLHLDAAKLLERWRTKLKDEKVKDREGDPTVAALLEISLESLKDVPRALFFILAQYAPQAIPEKLLEVTGWEDWREDLAILVDASLLEWNSRELTMHPFIRQAALQNLGREEAEAAWLAALILLFKALPDPEWSERWGEWALLHPHVASLWQRMPAPEPPQNSKWGSILAQVLGTAAQQFNTAGAYSKAEPLQREACRLAEATFGKDHLEVASYLSNLAADLHSTNQLAEAEPLLREVLRIYQHRFGASSPVVAMALNNLAQLLQDSSRLAEAETLTREALRIEQAASDPDHLRVTLYLNNLGQLLQASDRFAEAEPLIREVLRIHQSVFPADHPVIARDLNNLALLLRDTKRPAEAEPLMREVLRIDQITFGPDHPESAIHLNNLALLLQDTHRLTEAEPLMREALRIDMTALGSDHPRIATHLNNLANLLRDMGRSAEAEPLSRRQLWILAESGQRNGHPHPRFQAARVNYAYLLRTLGIPIVEIPERLRIAMEEKPPDTPESWGENRTG